MTTTSTNSGVHIFWDFESLPIKRPLQGYKVAKALTDIGNEHGQIRSVRAYMDCSDRVHPAFSAVRRELHASGISLIDCPSHARKDVSDKAIIVDMFTLILDIPPPHTFVVVTSDTDMSYALAVLRRRRYRIIIICPSEASLIMQADDAYDWKTRVIGPHDGGDGGGDEDDDTSSSSDGGGDAEDGGGDAEDGGGDAEDGGGDAEEDASSTTSMSTSVSGPIASQAASISSYSREKSQLYAPTSSHAGEEENTINAEQIPTGPTEINNLKRDTKANGFLFNMERSSPAEPVRDIRPITAPLATRARAQISEVLPPSPTQKPTIPESSFPPPIAPEEDFFPPPPAFPMERPNATDAQGNWTKKSPVSSPPREDKSPSSAGFVFVEPAVDTINGGPNKFDIKPDTTAAPIPRLNNDTRSAEPLSMPPKPSLANIPSQTNYTQPSSSRPTTLGSTPVVPRKSSTPPALPTPQTQQTSTSAPRALPEKYRLLVQRMQYHLSKKKSAPKSSQIASEILQISPNFYKQVGTLRWGPYVEQAKKDGIITTSHDSIVLMPEWVGYTV